jgi:hypothetical protein
MPQGGTECPKQKVRLVSSLGTLIRLTLDLWSIRLFVWLFGRNGELLDSHLFYFDRYQALADYHRMKGRIAKADSLDSLADAHYRAAPDDDEPPEAAAIAMPVPQPALNTSAVSTLRTSRSGERPPLGLVTRSVP